MITVREFLKKFPDDETCLQHIFEKRFGQGHVCPKCHVSAKWYRMKAERAFCCSGCGHHLHPTASTIFENTRTPLQMWFYAIFLFTTTRHGVSGKELQRQLGVTYKTAWRMGHKIREHMSNLTDDQGHLSGVVEVDETIIGPKKKGKPGRFIKDKTIVMGMVERGGKIVTEVVDNLKTATLLPKIKETVEEGSIVYTDSLWSYHAVGKSGYHHAFVNHTAGNHVIGDAHINTLEGYWRNLKAGIASTHVHVSQKYLRNYMKEFEYRYNKRNVPGMMLPELLTAF